MTVARVNIDQRIALAQLLLHLRTSLNLNERQCFVCVNPLGVELPNSVGGDRFVSIALQDGDYPFEETVEAQCYEASAIVVTGYIRIALDSRGRETEFLLHETRGILALKRDLLRALTGVDLQNPDEHPFLREWMSPRRAKAPDYDASKKIGWIQLIIPLEFDWDLSEPAP